MRLPKPRFSVKLMLVLVVVVAVYLNVWRAVRELDPTEKALSDLRGGDSDRRLAAVAALDEMGHRRGAGAVGPLCVALAHDPDLGVRLAACKALGGLDSHDPDAAAALLAAFRDPDATMREEAAGAIARATWMRSRPDVISALEEALDDPSGGVRSLAVAILAATRGTRIPEARMASLRDDPAPVVRASVLNAQSWQATAAYAGTLRSRPLDLVTVPELPVEVERFYRSAVAGLDDPSPLVRVTALKALRWVEEQHSLPRYLGTKAGLKAMSVALSDRAAEVRLIAAQVIYSRGQALPPYYEGEDPAADVAATLPALLRASRRKDAALIEAARAVVASLGKTPDPTALDVSEQVRAIEAARHAFGTLVSRLAFGGHALADSTRRSLLAEWALQRSDPDPKVRAFAASLAEPMSKLSRMGREGWSAHVRAALEDRDPSVRAMGVKDIESLALRVAWRKDMPRRVGGRFASALRRIGRGNATVEFVRVEAVVIRASIVDWLLHPDPGDARTLRGLLPDLLRTLDDPDPSVGHAAYVAAWKAAWWVEPRGGPARRRLRERTGRYVANLKGGPPEARRLAALALAWYDREDEAAASEALRAAKDDPDESVRMRSKYSLTAMDRSKMVAGSNPGGGWPDPALDALR